MNTCNYVPLLQCLVKAKPTKKFIESLPKEILNCIWESALNIERGNVKLVESESKYLNKRKLILRKLSSKSIGVSKKKKLLSPTLLQNILQAAIRHLNNGQENAASSGELG